MKVDSDNLNLERAEGRGLLRIRKYSSPHLALSYSGGSSVGRAAVKTIPLRSLSRSVRDDSEGLSMRNSGSLVQIRPSRPLLGSSSVGRATYYLSAIPRPVDGPTVESYRMLSRWSLVQVQSPQSLYGERPPIGEGFSLPTPIPATGRTGPGLSWLKTAGSNPVALQSTFPGRMEWVIGYIGSTPNLPQRGNTPSNN